MEVEAPRLIGVVDQVDLDEKGKVKYHFVIIDYVVSVKRGEPVAASDADALRWVPLGEVEGYDLTASFRRFFVKNRKKLEAASAAP